MHSHSSGLVREDGCPNFRCPLSGLPLQIAPELERALYLAITAHCRHPLRISSSLSSNFMLIKQPCELFCWGSDQVIFSRPGARTILRTSIQALKE